MIQEEGSQPSIKSIREQIFTPETFSPQSHSDPIKLLDISLNFPYSSNEWDTIFETFIALLEHKEWQIWDKAIDKLIYALEIEQSQRSNCDDYQPRPIDRRMKSICEAIGAQTLNKPNIFENFCCGFQFLAKEPPYNRLFLEWLDQLAASEEREIPTKKAILAAQVFLGAYDSTWQEVGENLLEMLDDADLLIRACTAYQIGIFYGKSVKKHEYWEWYIDENYKRNQQAIIGIPPLDEMMQLIYHKELDRPGIAGAFWDAIPKQGFDAKEWLLDILENSPEPEPYICYFPCNLAFDAHERFSRDAGAVRRLIDMGRVGLALAAATDESCKVAALEPLLIELGNYDDPEMIRLASWHLAYYYHCLHIRGAELGYVELVGELSTIDLFLLFSQKNELESPYAAVIYPKGTDGKLSRQTAREWVDRIFPEAVRGKPTELLLAENYCWYQRGYIDYHVSEENTNSNLIDNVIIGYRSQFMWNPKQFL